MLDAKKRGDESVSPRLRQHALSCVNHDDGQRRGRCASRHITGILLVARGIGDDEFSPVRSEVAVSHVDGDALLAFRRKAVNQEREIKRVALRAEFAAVGGKRGQLVIKDQF